MVYRETRAQELVDRLWSAEESPWHRRINMLGSSGTRGTMVTQSAWVRSIMASFVKSWDGRGDGLADCSDRKLVLTTQFYRGAWMNRGRF